MPIAAGFHYAWTGGATHPTILFLHGFLGSGQDWGEVAESLVDRFRCLLVDLPGHGRTPAPDDCSLPATAGRLAMLLAELEIPECFLVGYSMGGRVALQLALTHPQRVRRLVLESASPGLADEAERAARRAHEDRLARQLVSEPLESFLRRWYEQPLFESLHDDPARLEERIARRAAGDPNELARALVGLGTGRQPPLWDQLARLVPPALLIVGERDGKYRGVAEAMASRSSRLSVDVVENCGHDVHFEKPGEYTRLVKEYLGERSVPQG